MNTNQIQTIDIVREEIYDSMANHFFGIGINSENRFEKFLELKESLSDKEYWIALSYAYPSCDYLDRYYSEINDAFSSKRPYREFLMNKEESLFLNTLPEQITIYRGMFIQDYQTNYFGVSWTLSRKIAEFFMTNYQRTYYKNKGKRMVYEKIINKSEVIAYFGERNEQEIIYVQKPM